MSSPTIARSELDLPLVVTQLMKGVIYQDTHARPWRHLLQLQSQVRDYVAMMGLTVVVDEGEGYAFLRSRAVEDNDQDDGRDAVPRLIPRRALSFPVSLLLALLRKRLAEFDASDSGTRCVLSRDQIVDMMQLFLPSGSNEARLVEQIDTHIAKAIELGFLRRVKDQEGLFEIRRILKAFVDAQWLAGFDQGLARYAAQLGVTGVGTADSSGGY